MDCEAKLKSNDGGDNESNYCYEYVYVVMMVMMPKLY